MAGSHPGRYAPRGLSADLLSFEEFLVEKGGSSLETVDCVEMHHDQNEIGTRV